jgi:sec-independent protein translocase protein TatA
MFADPIEWVVIGVIVVVVFMWGPAKIPELAKSLGLAKREFEKAQKEESS